jgi:hypothetical protein
MIDSTNIQKAVDKILNFTGFFLTLGDLKQTDLLIAIANRDPEFTYYFETATEPIETALDFFKVYANWAISRIRAEYNTVWDDVKDACACSEKYKILKMQCADTMVLWDELEKVLNSGGDK